MLALWSRFMLDSNQRGVLDRCRERTARDPQVRTPDNQLLQTQRFGCLTSFNWLIAFGILEDYECNREGLVDDTVYRVSAADLVASAAGLNMQRSFTRHQADASSGRAKPTETGDAVGHRSS